MMHMVRMTKTFSRNGSGPALAGVSAASCGRRISGNGWPRPAGFRKPSGAAISESQAAQELLIDKRLRLAKCPAEPRVWKVRYVRCRNSKMSPAGMADKSAAGYSRYVKVVPGSAKAWQRPKFSSSGDKMSFSSIKGARVFRLANR